MDSNDFNPSDKQNEKLEKRKQCRQMKKIEKRLSIFDMQIISKRNSKIYAKPTKVPCMVNPKAYELKNQIAEDITSVVGLKEAITWPHKDLRNVWAIFLFLGVVLTIYFVWASAKEYLSDPTATKVSLVPHLTYDYPPIILCTEAWLDVPKALSFGLSLDALKYSLGYFNNVDTLILKNATNQTRDEFLEFYRHRNFTSLDDYYQTIAIDVQHTTTKDDFASSSVLAIYCSDCDPPPRKIFYVDGVCYLLQLAPVSGNRSRKSQLDQSKTIFLKVVDQTENIIQVTSQWKMYITKKLNQPLKFFSESRLKLPKFTLNYVRITVEQYINSDCRDKIVDYSSELCYFDCLSRIYDQKFNCFSFLNSITIPNIDPIEYCNILETNVSSYFDRQYYMRDQNHEIADYPEALQCSDKCPIECSRYVYDTALRWQTDEENIPTIWHETAKIARRLNMTIIGLNIGLQSLRQGGIFTLKEVSTLSFTTLVSNLGGALGLFVGGTMMTFVQVILFCIKYFLDKRQKK